MSYFSISVLRLKNFPIYCILLWLVKIDLWYDNCYRFLFSISTIELGSCGGCKTHIHTELKYKCSASKRKAIKSFKRNIWMRKCFCGFRFSFFLLSPVLPFCLLYVIQVQPILKHLEQTGKKDHLSISITIHNFLQCRIYIINFHILQHRHGPNNISILGSHFKLNNFVFCEYMSGLYWKLLRNKWIEK